MQEVRHSTTAIIKIGPVVNSTGVTPVTSLTIGGADEAEILKFGTTATLAIAGTLSAIANSDGWYNMTISTGDTSALGPMTVVIQDDSLCLPVFKDLMVVGGPYYDNKYGTTTFKVDIEAVSGDTTAANNLELACDNYSATRGLAGTALPAVAADGVGGLPISDAGGLDLDTQLANTNEITVARMGALTDWINGGRLDLILDIIAADVVNIDGDAMRGTDSANTTVPDAAGTAPTAIENRQEMDSNSTQLGAILADVTGINGDVMRGTDNAALASVLGALADAAAAGDPTASDTVMQYVKQLINILAGTTGIVTFPAESAPGNNVSLAEVIRAIHVDVTGLNGDVMRGTDGANTTVPDAAGTTPTAIENRQEMDSNSTQLSAILADVTGINGDAMRGTDSAALASVATEARLAELDAGNLPTDIAAIPTLPGIKKNVALSNFYFTMILASDDITPGTGLTVSCQISKDGGAYAGATNSGTISEVGNGDYAIDLTQTEMNADTIALRFTAATANETKLQIKTSS